MGRGLGAIKQSVSLNFACWRRFDIVCLQVLCHVSYDCFPRLCSLLAIKRLTLQAEAEVKLTFVAPAANTYDMKLFFMCDAYLGCDQENEFTLHVHPASEMAE